MTELQRYGVTAFNTATASANKIHDDDVARSLGFGGGLVPGVDVYAYLTHPPVATWGVDWLRRGAMRARFRQPVYDGDAVEIRPVGAGALELHSGERLCATADASFPESRAEPPDLARWPAVEPATEPPAATPESLAVGTTLALAPHTFRADRAPEYLDDVRETLPLYRDEGIAHPGWLLRDANYVLSANVRLGPWIHVESVVQHFDVVRDGDAVSARAVVTGEWERAGHRFVELDVVHLAGDGVVARTTHTAIYQPRGAAR